MPIDAYFQTLFGMVAKPISEFMQAEHTGAVPKAVIDEKDPTMQWTMPATLHKKVIGGFCRGASLDWLRKVVQRDDPARYEITHRKWSRVSRMANTQIEYTEAGSKALEAMGAKTKADVAAATNAKNTAIAQARSLLIAWAEGNGCTFAEDAKGMSIGNAPTPEIDAMIRPKFAEYNEAVKQARARVTQTIAAADAKIDAWNAASGGEKVGMSWSDIARRLGTDAGKKRTFSGLTPVAGSTTKTFAELRSYVIDAVSAPAFIPGRGMLISLDFVPEPGHAIAAHKESADSYVLFDPNLGIYRCKSLHKFVTALVVLVEECYLAAGPGEPETSLGSGHYWHVFCRTGDLIPGTATKNTATIDDARMAFDNVEVARQSFAETTRFVADEALEEAEHLHVAYNKDKVSAAQKRWIDAHNEAVVAVRRSRMSDTDAKRVYADFDRATITLRARA